MTRKKSGFWTFICSLVPGAGEMYLGFMKQGVSLMCIFAGWFAFCMYFYFEVGLFALPVIWFYSFFHVHNLASLPDEEFYQQEDYYMLLHMDKVVSIDKWERGRVKFVAVVLIFVGCYTILSGLLDAFWIVFPGWLGDGLLALRQGVPRIVISLILIVFGVYLIRGKKVRLDEEPEVVYDIPATPVGGERSETAEKFETSASDQAGTERAPEVIILGTADENAEEH